jgi:hypothetical protein
VAERTNLASGPSNVMITSARAGEKWVFEYGGPDKNSIDTLRFVSAGSTSLEYEWNGKTLLPKRKPHVFEIGVGIWNGLTVEWLNSIDKTANIAYSYTWNEHQNIFQPDLNVETKWAVVGDTIVSITTEKDPEQTFGEIYKADGRHPFPILIVIEFHQF